MEHFRNLKMWVIVGHLIYDILLEDRRKQEAE